jgi:hypothetical protein
MLAVGVGQCVATSFRGREFLFIVSALALPLRQSRAVGVGQILTAVASPSPLSALAPF